MDRPHVVIVGGGFGGLYAARSLGRTPVAVTLVDRRNFHLFQPLLYQVATGGLSPGEIASPLRAVLRRQANVRVLQAEVREVAAAARRVMLDGGVLDYDYLVLATGVTHDYLGHDDWARFAPGLKTVEEATAIRSQIFRAFESAEREEDEATRRAFMTFVVVGGGATGVELAGAIGELAHATLRRDFRRIRTPDARILLVEAAGRLLTSYPESLSAKAARSLGKLGVRVRTGWLVRDIDATGVALERNGVHDRIEARTVLWAAGVKASPLGASLARSIGAQTDRFGRVAVGPDCSVPGHPEIFVIGDLARFSGPSGDALPGTAPVAMQMGRHVARVLRDRLQGREPRSFRYRDRGNLAVIGRAAAVADIRGLHLSGYPAWLLWLFVHILYLVEYENRLLVLIQWAWSYFTRKRGARLITESGTHGSAGDR